MKQRRFAQCDVFSSTPARGNGLAVVIEAEGLSDADMQNFAAWTNLAETTFLLPPTDPQADYRVRIFTPAREMPFAGHPTLGSCAVWLDAGGSPREPGRIRQQCNIGLVDIVKDAGDRLAFRAPPTNIDAMSDDTRDSICAGLGISNSKVLRCAELNNGPAWLALELESAEDVLGAVPSGLRAMGYKSVGIIGAHPPVSDLNFEVRMLEPSSGMQEDPITGSLNSALAAWLHGQGRLNSPVTVAQGTCIGRHGRVYITPGDTAEDILIGGDVNILIRGSLEL